MKMLGDIVEFVSGSPQFRIKEVLDDKAPIYIYYGQSDIEDDLVGIDSNSNDRKQVRTFDKVSTLSEGDIIFSLISGKSTIVSRNHLGYLYTQNYIKLVPNDKVDSKYLVYLLNEDIFIKRQLQTGLQGSQVLKYTLKQMKEIELPNHPAIERQCIVGELYFNQLRKEALNIRKTKLETTIVLATLEEVIRNERERV